MKHFWILLYFLFVGCGKQTNQAETAPPAPPPNQPIYIVSGQSNAQGLLSVTHGFEWYQWNGYPWIVHEQDKPMGYAVGGSSILWWKTADIMPLLSFVISYCTDNTYFIWWQGESDANPTGLTYFETETKAFISKVNSYCPKMKVVIVTIGDINNSSIPDPYDIQQIQENLPYLHFSARPYATGPDGVHVTNSEQLRFWDDIRAVYK